MLDRPRETVRGWLQAFSSHAEALRAHFRRWALALDARLDAIEPAGIGVRRRARGDRARDACRERPFRTTVPVVLGERDERWGAPFPHELALSRSALRSEPPVLHRWCADQGRKKWQPKKEEQRQRRAEDVALFRYALVREAADEKLSKSERGRIVRSLAEAAHTGPDGTSVTVSRPTIDRWIRAYRSGGFSALRPTPRRVEPRTPAGLLMLACDLRREDPARTAAHIAEMLTESHEWSPHPRTLQRHFAALGLTRAALTGQNIAFGRFEATRPNELWVGDALHGPVVGGQKAILFCFLDDHSRLVTGHRWTYQEDTLSAESALRRGVLSRGVPATVYLDNGSSFVSKQLLRALAILGAAPRPLPAGSTAGPREDRALLPHGPRPVPRRGRRTPRFPPSRFSSSASSPGANASITAGSTPRPEETPLERFFVARRARRSHRWRSSARRSCSPRRGR